MHITVLRQGQTLHTYARADTLLHLSLGSVRISSLARELPGHAAEVTVPEGGAYVVQRSGWLQISAQRPSELLCQEPAPGWVARLSSGLLQDLTALIRRWPERPGVSAIDSTSRRDGERSQ